MFRIELQPWIEAFGALMLEFMYVPFSVSCQTIPSSVTAVPGSHGPRQSGSVTVPTLQVSTATSCVGTGLELVTMGDEVASG